MRKIAFLLTAVTLLSSSLPAQQRTSSSSRKTGSSLRKTGSSSRSKSRIGTPAEVAIEVDKLLDAVWEEGFLETSGEVEPAALLRRMSIDLRGVIPYSEEIHRFLDDDDPQRVGKWARWLLGTPDFADYFAETWEFTLLSRRGDTDGLDRPSFRAWLRQNFLTNRPYDQIAHELLTSSGRPEDNPAVNFFIRYGSSNTQEMAKDVAARVSKVFLGTRIECAQCHDHPYVDVKREQFWGVAAFFAQTESYRQRDRAGGRSDIPGIRDKMSGEMQMPPMKFGARPVIIPPVVFGTEVPKAIPMSSKKDSKDKKNDSRYGKQVKPKRKTSKPRRETFAKWVTSGKNPFFARAFVNRIWAHFMGKGFVNPVDDFTSESRVIYPELLDFLAADFVASKFDIKRLIEIIVSTKSYRLRALEGVPGGVAKGESHDYFSMMPIRPLPAEVLARSVLRATGMEEPHPKKNARQVQRYLKKAKDMFARRFGVDESEMRQEFQGTVLQALLLFNGEFTDGKAPAARVFHASYEKELSGSLDAVLEGARPEQQIDKLFMNILTRRPTDDELQPFMQHVLSRRTDKDRQKALADVQWALLNSAEFLHQH